MADEQKTPPKPVEAGETQKPAPGAGGVAPPAKTEVKSAPKPPSSPAAGPPSGTPAPPKSPGTVAPKPPAAAKAPVKPDPWSSPLVDELQRKFPGAISEPVIFRKLPGIIVAKEHLAAICQFLKGEQGGAYTLLTDHTAVDYPKREKRFDIIYLLYSFTGNDRLRLKVLLGEGEALPSVAGIWPTANWLEREVYDMFGVVYEGHPDLKRILLPDEWSGHPLRKDYDILRQDDAWVKSNLGIESGQ
jgi:NADH-quinone oxidoreductase subunit C